MSQVQLQAADLPQRRERRIDALLRKEELANLRFLAWIRTWALAVVALWLLAVGREPHLVENVASCILFIAFGWTYYAITRSKYSRPWYALFFPLIDAFLLVDNLLPIMPWNASHLPFPVLLRFGTFAFLFVPFALSAFHHSPWRTLWNAVVVTLAWSAAVLYILMQPGAFGESHLEQIAAQEPRRLLAIMCDPNFVDLASVQSIIFVLLTVGALLSVLAWRTRGLVRRQVTVERGRAQLARYFSPNLIDELEELGEPLGSVRTQNVAVLFADIVGFTRISERLAPERVIELLRSFHRRMASVVFAHDGTLDKYIGDAVMATFGTPRSGARDALNALAAARAMIDELARWNEKRLSRGAEPIRIGIGVHYGLAVLGDIGDERRLEFAVIGDTVNVASRIERFTRVTGSDILASQDVVDAARKESEAEAARVLEGFTVDRPRKLRGRREPVTLWSYRRTAPELEAAGAA